MIDWQTIDFFNDASLIEDPYPYFDALRAAGPVVPLPHLGVIAVTGYDEMADVYRRSDVFSSCNAVIGPYATSRCRWRVTTSARSSTSTAISCR